MMTVKCETALEGKIRDGKNWISGFITGASTMFVIGLYRIFKDRLDEVKEDKNEEEES